MFESSGRQSWASVNLITAHDGFTLRDLVSYEHRHNEANGEGNADGHGHNLSWNNGAEGPTDDPGILAARARQQRNLLASLFLSIGTPMVTMGDELGRTQMGNNNAYCQDNEISWMDWEGADEDLTAVVRVLAGIRRSTTAFHRSEFLSGHNHNGTGLKDVYWLAPEGREMTEGDWHDPERRTLGCQLGNEDTATDRILILFNADAEAIEFKLAEDFPGTAWEPVFDTARKSGHPGRASAHLKPGGMIPIGGRSLLLLRHRVSVSA